MQVFNRHVSGRGLTVFGFETLLISGSILIAAQVHNSLPAAVSALWKIVLVTALCELCFYYNDLYDLTLRARQARAAGARAAGRGRRRDRPGGGLGAAAVADHRPRHPADVAPPGADRGPGMAAGVRRRHPRRASRGARAPARHRADGQDRRRADSRAARVRLPGGRSRRRSVGRDQRVGLADSRDGRGPAANPRRCITSNGSSSA